MSDPRLLLVQGDVAAASLEGTVAAARFVPTRRHTVAAPAAPLRREPRLEAEQMSQLLFGEAFDVLVEEAGFAFGQAGRDGYVGWVDLDLLIAGAGQPTHRVKALRTYAFTEPSIKVLPDGLYSLNCLVEVEAREGRFVKARHGGWFVADHLAPLGEVEADPVDVALRFLGAPYLWGGNESLGLDCSGLVQQALRACGIACPRDSDQQMTLGEALEAAEPLQRGDLVFWRGHVGFVSGEDTLLHANGHHMAVVAESLEGAIRRIEAAGSGLPTGRRRMALA